MDPEPPNLALVVGLVSGLGTIFVGTLCGIIWYVVSERGGIRLGNGEPGSYDDMEAFLAMEEEALETMSESAKRSYFQARAFCEQNPPNSINTDISLSQFMSIQEKGVQAWEFDVEFPNVNCFVEARTELEFYDLTSSVQTNLPVPRQNDVYYWEAKIYEKPPSTVIAVGYTTKPYPTFRLPGYHRYSVAYDSQGNKRVNQPFQPSSYGPIVQPGDVVGVGYRPRTGTVFFTRNGKKLEDAVTGLRMNLFPTIGTTGPATVHVNFGHAAFVYIEANVKKWGLAPARGSRAPPPAYGDDGETVLLEANGVAQPPLPDIPTANQAFSLPRLSAQSPEPQHSGSLTNEESVRTSSRNFQLPIHRDSGPAELRYSISNSPPPFSGETESINMSNLAESTVRHNHTNAAHHVGQGFLSSLVNSSPPPSYVGSDEEELSQSADRNTLVNPEEVIEQGLQEAIAEDLNDRD